MTAVASRPDAVAVAQTLRTYFEAIDSKNYSGAYDTYSPTLQAKFAEATWAKNETTSQIVTVAVAAITTTSTGVVASVSFTTHQAALYGPTGQTCTRWNLNYTLIPASGSASSSYLINAANPVGVGHQACNSPLSIGSESAGSVPVGYSSYADPATGFKIAYPSTWTLSTSGTETVFTDPTDGAFMMVQYQEPAGPSAIAAWQSESQSFAKSHGDYTQLELIGGTQSATWEYTYVDASGTLQQAVDYGFIVNAGEYGFALNSQAPEADWSSMQNTFDQIRGSFVAPNP